MSADVTTSPAAASAGFAIPDRSSLPGGARRVTVAAGGQTFASGFFDTVDNGGAPDTRFVFDPGHGLAVLRGFRPDGTDHDTIDLPGADFGDSLAAVLRDSRAGAGGLVITDPVSGDTIRIAGLAKATLAHNPQDIAFHP